MEVVKDFACQTIFFHFLHFSSFLFIFLFFIFYFLFNFFFFLHFFSFFFSFFSFSHFSSFFSFFLIFLFFYFFSVLLFFFSFFHFFHFFHFFFFFIFPHFFIFFFFHFFFCFIFSFFSSFFIFFIFSSKKNFLFFFFIFSFFFISFSFSFLGCSKSDFFFFASIASKFLVTFQKKIEPSRGGERGREVPLWFLFSFFSLVFFFSFFLDLFMFSSFFFHFYVKKKVSSFLFSCISFKYILLPTVASEFNCFFRCRCSMEMWCLDDIGRESWDWVGPLARERACFNSPEWGGGSSPVKTEPLQIVLLLLLTQTDDGVYVHIRRVANWQAESHNLKATGAQRPKTEPEKCCN